MARANDILVDTGPLVAVFNHRDALHAACVEVFKSLRTPLLTVWPVVTEAMHLLGSASRAQEGLWQLLLTQALLVLPLGDGDVRRMHELVHQYRNQPMDLADAALTRVAEREKIATIFTIDQRDFRVVRPRHVPSFHLLPKS